MNRFVPSAELNGPIMPRSPACQNSPFVIETMLRIHFMRQSFGLSDPAIEEALFGVPLYREFALLPDGPVRLPDESTILRFRHWLECHGLAAEMFGPVNAPVSATGLMGSVVEATPASAPSSTKNGSGTRDPEMYQTKKRNNPYFGRNPTSRSMQTRAWSVTKSALPRTSMNCVLLANCCTARRSISLSISATSGATEVASAGPLQ